MKSFLKLLQGLSGFIVFPSQTVPGPDCYLSIMFATSRERVVVSLFSLFGFMNWGKNIARAWVEGTKETGAFALKRI